MQEYNIALSYFFALAIVCIALYAFTYFLPKPDNDNKAKSTFYFRLLLLFTMAAFEAILLRYQYPPILSLLINNTFIFLMSYTLMFAIYTRYDKAITRRHYYLLACHGTLFLLMLYYIQTNINTGFVRATFVLLNVFIPYFFTLRMCNIQFKMHRLGDRVLYGSILMILFIFIIYVTLYIFFFSQESQIPLILYFVSLLTFICVLFFGFALSIIYSLVGKLRKEIITDRLTGAKNRNYLKDISKQLFSSARRKNTALSLIICDIDWFKNINDTYGHYSGDKVLIQFSTAIENALRAEDVFIRIGGEEFVILLPYNDLEEAVTTAERLRKIINDLSIHVEIDKINISASFGVTQVNLKKDIDSNINRADMALYEAKRSGRNKVVAYKN